MSCKNKFSFCQNYKICSTDCCEKHAFRKANIVTCKYCANWVLIKYFDNINFVFCIIGYFFTWLLFHLTKTGKYDWLAYKFQCNIRSNLKENIHNKLFYKWKVKNDHTRLCTKRKISGLLLSVKAKPTYDNQITLYSTWWETMSRTIN